MGIYASVMGMFRESNDSVKPRAGYTEVSGEGYTMMVFDEKWNNLGTFVRENDSIFIDPVRNNGDFHSTV